MATQVYTFKVTYDGLEDKLWRIIQVSSRYPLNRLGYCILATFDTLAKHLFYFEFQNQRFVIPDEWEQPLSSDRDMGAVRLEQLRLQIGDTLEMLYDYGTTQHFRLALTEVAPMEKGKGTHYPYILAGEGRGILDDYPAEELAKYIHQIDRHGKTREEIYYNGCSIPWDYRNYYLDLDNDLLKGEIHIIEEGYRPFWEQ